MLDFKTVENIFKCETPKPSQSFLPMVDNGQHFALTFPTNCLKYRRRAKPLCRSGMRKAFVCVLCCACLQKKYLDFFKCSETAEGINGPRNLILLPHILPFSEKRLGQKNDVFALQPQTLQGHTVASKNMSSYFVFLVSPHHALLQTIILSKGEKPL